MTSDEATLARLMCAAQAGDALAYRQLLGMAAPLLMRWFRRKVAPADLDDLVQDTLLPSAQAAAIRAVKIEGLSVIEAAARLGQSESMIKVNVHRGLKRMAAAVDEDR